MIVFVRSWSSYKIFTTTATTTYYFYYTHTHTWFEPDHFAVTEKRQPNAILMCVFVLFQGFNDKFALPTVFSYDSANGFNDDNAN